MVWLCAISKVWSPLGISTMECNLGPVHRMTCLVGVCCVWGLDRFDFPFYCWSRNYWGDCQDLIWPMQCTCQDLTWPLQCPCQDLLWLIQCTYYKQSHLLWTPGRGQPVLQFIIFIEKTLNVSLNTTSTWFTTSRDLLHCCTQSGRLAANRLSRIYKEEIWWPSRMFSTLIQDLRWWLSINSSKLCVLLLEVIWKIHLPTFPTSGIQIHQIWNPAP